MDQRVAFMTPLITCTKGFILRTSNLKVTRCPSLVTLEDSCTAHTCMGGDQPFAVEELNIFNGHSVDKSF